MSDREFEGKVAVVTGAGSGIGRAIAVKLANMGASVVVNDIHEESGQAAADEIGGLFVHGDLSQREACGTLIKRTVSEYGGLHILVNNAGLQHVDAIEAFPEDTWEKMLAVMLTAPFLLTRYAWPSMKAQGWGRVINIASRLATRGALYKSAYVAAKHGVLGLTKVTALEGGPLGITANAICPAFVRTPLMENQIADLARTQGLPAQEVIEKIMLEPCAIKRLIEPEEVAEIVAFLCRDAGSAFSGVPMMIDLGSTAS